MAVEDLIERDVLLHRLERQEVALGRRRHSVFVDAIDNFRRGIGLQRWRPWWYPIPISAFGTGTTRSAARYDREQRGPHIEHLDHMAFLGAPRRLAVVMAWPYVSKATIESYAATALADPRFVVGVDDGDQLGMDGLRPPSGIYGASTTGWIIADGQTLGGEIRARQVVAAFLAGAHGLAEGAEVQRKLDLENHDLYECKRRLTTEPL